jgi:hypothetical protein
MESKTFSSELTPRSEVLEKLMVTQILQSLLRNPPVDRPYLVSDDLYTFPPLGKNVNWGCFKEKVENTDLRNITWVIKPRKKIRGWGA